MSSNASCAISGSGKTGCACIPAPTRRAKRPSIRGSTTPSPTTTPNRSWRSPPPETSGSARVRLSHHLVQRPPALRRQLFRVAGAPRNPKKPVFDFRAHFCHSAPWKRTLSASDPGQLPGGPKAISYQFNSEVNIVSMLKAIAASILTVVLSDRFSETEIVRTFLSPRQDSLNQLTREVTPAQ